NGAPDPSCQAAENGNVALAGEIGFSAGKTTTLLALGFGASPEEAADLALASLKQGFEPAAETYVENWRKFQAGLEKLDRPAASGLNTYRVSTAVLATHLS
ncbi:glucan 1,4-alpha-glucosidase, partial [Mesorhizobium sp. M2E.F.Ca.ET.209.01.1.1]